MPPRAASRVATPRSSRPSDVVECFAVAAPGLEPLVAGELRALGIDARVEAGGAAWSGTIESVALANLWLRTASRVLVRAAAFHARTFYELERHARQIPWQRFLRAGTPVRFRVTSRKSKLYHTGAIAQRLGDAVARTAGSASVVAVVSDDDGEGEGETTGGEEGGGQLFVVRVHRDDVVVSADSSGDHLHRRGYRQALAKAPLRETLAAATLLGAGWTGDRALVDPLCGSGTIPIEGALLARRIAPGLQRSFALLDWPELERARWQRLLDDARGRVLPRVSAAIVGADRDEGAIRAARQNASRAGVADDIEWQVAALSTARPPAGSTRGLVATNPPYGVRVGETKSLRDLYARLGALARGPFAGWDVAVMSPGAQLDAHLGLALEERFRTTNGGIPVRLVVRR